MLNMIPIAPHPLGEDELVETKGKTPKHENAGIVSSSEKEKASKKKKKKSKKDKDRKKELLSSNLVDRVPAVHSCHSTQSQDRQDERSRPSRYETENDPAEIASDDDGDDRYSVASRFSRAGKSSAGVSLLSDDSDESGARWRSWDEDYFEQRDSSPTDDEMATNDEKKKKKKKHKHKHKSKSKRKDKSDKKTKKSKKNKSTRSENSTRDQPVADHEVQSTAETKQETRPAIQGHDVLTPYGQDHCLVEEVEIEHISTVPAEMDEAIFLENQSANIQETVSIAEDVKKDSLPYIQSIMSVDTFGVDSEDGHVTNMMTSNAKTKSKKTLLELDEYSVNNDTENQSALVQCLRFYSCNGIARLIEYQPKLLPPVSTAEPKVSQKLLLPPPVSTAEPKESQKLSTTSANQDYELLLGVKSPIASDPVENILAGGPSEDSLDNLKEAPSLDMLKRNPSVVMDLTGKNLCLDDEATEDNRSRKTGQGSRHRKRTPRNNDNVTVTSIEIPEMQVSSVSDSDSHTLSYLGINSNRKKSAKSLPVNKSDKSVKSLPVYDKKAPKRGHWRQRQHLISDDRSVHSVRSTASSKGSTSMPKKRVAQSFFLRMQGRRAQC